MGADKAGVSLAGRSLLCHVAERLRPQVGKLAVIGGQPDFAQQIACDWRDDAIPGGMGPLAGILSALEWALSGGGADVTSVVICPVDMPFLPHDLARKLSPLLAEVEVCLAKYDARTQYMASAWRADLAPALRDYLKEAQNLSIRAFTARCSTHEVPFELCGGDQPNPFANINTPADLAAAEQWLSKGP